jgi:hypothetical protein
MGTFETRFVASLLKMRNAGERGDKKRRSERETGKQQEQGASWVRAPWVETFMLNRTGQGLQNISTIPVNDLPKAHSGDENLHFLAVNGCGKMPFASRSFMSHSGAP